MSVPMINLLRESVIGIHRLVACSSVLSRCYLAGCRGIAPRLSKHRRSQLLNALSSVDWPSEVLNAVPVVVGDGTSINLIPHNGEFDFKAVLGGRLPYEEEVFRFLDSRMGRYSAVVEIGANVGVFSLYFAVHLQKQGGRVYVFEPSRKAYARLQENTRLNGLTNLECFNAAVSDKSGLLPFHEPDGHLTNGSLLPEFAAQFSNEVTSRSVLALSADQLDVLFAGQKKILLKMDVEGYEAPLIRALAPLIEKYQPDLLIEVLPSCESAIEEAISTAAPAYRKYAITSVGLKEQTQLHAEDGRDCFLCPVGHEPRPNMLIA